MAFLVGTNVISETMRARPSAAVLAWLSTRDPADLYLSAPGLGALARGACTLREENRRARFQAWIETELTHQFAGRILPFDAMAAITWGRLMGDGDRARFTPSAADAQIAAIAIVNGLTLATRNTRDFDGLGVTLLDPWIDA